MKNKLKALGRIIFLAMITFFPIAGNAQENNTLLMTTPFYDGTGTSFTLKDFAGKVLVLFLWSADCPICRDALPKLEKLRQRWQADVTVIPLMNKEASVAKARRIYALLNVRSLPIYIDEKDALSAVARPEAYPFIILFNAKDEIVMQKAGKIDWLKEKVEEMIFNTDKKLRRYGKEAVSETVWSAALP